MAALAGQSEMRPGEWEGGCGMIKGHLFPGCGDMAAGAVLTQAALVSVVFLMTGEALGGRAFQHPVLVTRFAFYGSVSPGQWESSGCMVEGNLRPCRSDVTLCAIRSQSALVVVILLMAGNALRRGAFKYIVGMAAQTGHGGVCAGELEFGEGVMVEGSTCPGGGGVAGGAVCAEPAGVDVIL